MRRNSAAHPGKPHNPLGVVVKLVLSMAKWHLDPQQPASGRRPLAAVSWKGGHRVEDNRGVLVVKGLEAVGREDELVRLRQLVGSLPEGPRGTLIRGDVGIGKTVLWRAAVEAAKAAGARVLTTRCAEAEIPLAFGGLADLVEDTLAEVADDLAQPQRDALAVALGLEAPRETSPDPIALPRAAAACLRALARRAPVVLCVDDIQWLDASSRRVLAFAVKRLGDAPVAVLVTQRGEGRDPLDLSQALGEGVFDEIRLGPLSVGALSHLVRSRLGVRIPRPTLARLHEASGGNPMFALEFARAVCGGDARLAGGDVLPLPASLEELVLERVAGLPTEIRPLLAAVAAVERPTLALLAKTIDGADSLLDEAIAADAVMLGDDGLVRFTHPLLASAVYAGLRPAQRCALHARVAEVLEDLEERARHLALASPREPSADVASLLDEAAARAQARGAPDAAAELAQQAVRLTPTAEASERQERALTVANYLTDAGQTVEAAACVDDLLSEGLTGERRARALLIRFHNEHDVEARGRAAEEALEHAGDDAGLRARGLLFASLCELNREHVAASEALARQALAEAERAEDPALLATALAAVAARAGLTGSPEAALLERAIDLADVHGTLPRTTSPRVVLAEQRLELSGDLAGARQLLELELDALRDRGRERERQRVLTNLAELESLAGNWDRAQRYLQEAGELAADAGDRFWEVQLWPRKARLEALRGNVQEARRLADLGVAHGEAVRHPAGAPASRWALGLLALSLGEPERAWGLLTDAADRWDFQWAILAIPDAVEALVGLGRLEDAEGILARFKARWSEHRWAMPAARRCRALLLMARGEAETALEAAEEAADAFEAAGFPLDQGRALLVAGEALRREGERRRAAEKLEVARAIFAELGAALWVDRADSELRRARPRPRSDRALTDAERRVAALVTSGKTNREAAARLFTTVSTVEAHLTRIYRKLGVRSRTELARHVSDSALSLADW